jgi:hypothetical protein
MTTKARNDGAVLVRTVHQQDESTATRPEALSGLIARQRAAFLRDGPPSVAERRAT